MKRILFVLIFAIGYSFNVSAQVASTPDTCSFLKNVQFENGLDTVVIKALYRASAEGSDEPRLKILADKQQLNYKEYVSADFGSNAISFMPIGCSRRFDGTLSRKVYDKTFVRKTKNLKEYLKETFDVDSLKPGQVIYLTCLVFEEQKTKSRSGRYFFTIIDLSLTEK